MNRNDVVRLDNGRQVRIVDWDEKDGREVAIAEVVRGVGDDQPGDGCWFYPEQVIR